MDSWFEVRRVDAAIWVLVEPHADSVNAYVMVGEERALLVDTGLGIGDIRRTVESLTRLPLVVVNTHAHYDHIGGNHLFGAVAAHRAEKPQIERGVPREELTSVADPSAFLAPAPPGFDPTTFAITGVPVTRLLEEGDAVDLGARTLEVLHTPGHSPGSISLWERDTGILFVGDVLYKGNLFACLPGSDFGDYLETLRRLNTLEPPPRLVLPGHGPAPLRPEDIRNTCTFFEEVAAGVVRGQPTTSPWGRVLVYRGPGFNLLLPEAGPNS